MPEYYSDVKSLPHVQVALRQKQQGKSDTELVNNFIPYLICETKEQKELDEKAGKPAVIHLADKAYSPDELLAQRGKLTIDTQWYITQQIMPPITRLIEHIDGINVDFVAQCLGVDPKKYSYHHSKGDAADEQNTDPNLPNALLKTELQKNLKDRSIATFKIVCP